MAAKFPPFMTTDTADVAVCYVKPAQSLLPFMTAPKVGLVVGWRDAAVCSSGLPLPEESETE